MKLNQVLMSCSLVIALLATALAVLTEGKGPLGELAIGTVVVGVVATALNVLNLGKDLNKVVNVVRLVAGYAFVVVGVLGIVRNDSHPNEGDAKSNAVVGLGYVSYVLALVCGLGMVGDGMRSVVGVNV